MGLYKVLAFTSGVIALSANALAAQASFSNKRYFVQDATQEPKSGEGIPDTTGVIGDVKKEAHPAAVQEADDEEDDSNSSDAIRSRRNYSAEFFTDYSTFVTDQEDFSPLAYGLKGYYFYDRDLKLGASIAVEQFQFNDDESDVINKQIVKRNIDVDGTAVRFGLHAQYFVENSMNAQFSVFGAAGKTEKEHGVDSQFYGRSGITVALGNQWSWEDFTFSWNWLSLTYNTTAKIGGLNLLSKYPSNRSGGMVLVSGLSFGAEW